MKRKMKTLSSLKRRIKKTASGKFKRRHGGTNHNNGCKSKGQKQRLHASAMATKGQTRKLRQLVPYK